MRVWTSEDFDKRLWNQLTQMILERQGKGLEKNSKRLEKKCLPACTINSGAFYLNLLFVEFWVDGPLHRKPSITCGYSQVLQQACARHWHTLKSNSHRRRLRWKSTALITAWLFHDWALQNCLNRRNTKSVTYIPAIGIIVNIIQGWTVNTVRTITLDMGTIPRLNHPIKRYF
jgi:hypothetical protein